MYYFLKNKDFNLGEYDFDIVCTPRFTKKEQMGFDWFVNSFAVNKEFCEFNEDKLKMTEAEIQKEIHNLTKKTIYCRIFKENIEISKSYFNIFDIVVIESGKVIYNFNSVTKTNKS